MSRHPAEWSVNLVPRREKGKFTAAEFTPHSPLSQPCPHAETLLRLHEKLTVLAPDVVLHLVDTSAGYRRVELSAICVSDDKATRRAVFEAILAFAQAEDVRVARYTHLEPERVRAILRENTERKIQRHSA